MIAFFAKSGLTVREILKRAESLDILVLSPESVKSMEELELAQHLSSKSESSGTAIAKKHKYEFLLWLTGKTDIKSAMKKSVPKSPDRLLLAVFGEERGHVLDSLDAVELHGALLAKSADSLRIEEISLSRIRN